VHVLDNAPAVTAFELLVSMNVSSRQKNNASATLALSWSSIGSASNAGKDGRMASQSLVGRPLLNIDRQLEFPSATVPTASPTVVGTATRERSRD